MRKTQMNERINQLMLEAKLGPALLLHYWKNIDALTDSEQEVLEQIEKFAELIVKEMLRTCEDHPAWTGRMIGEQIKQHFGVEE